LLLPRRPRGGAGRLGVREDVEDAALLEGWLHDRLVESLRDVDAAVGDAVVPSIARGKALLALFLRRAVFGERVDGGCCFVIDPQHALLAGGGAVGGEEAAGGRGAVLPRDVL
jgi:hypothetical protein